MSSSDAGLDVTVFPPGDATLEDAPRDSTSPIRSRFRVAHVSSDLGPIDFCYRRAGTTSYLGPILAGAATPSIDGGRDATASNDAATDAAAAPSYGLSFGSITDYVDVNGSGVYELVIVAAGDLGCSRPRALGSVSIDAGKESTVVIMGLFRADVTSSSALSIVRFVDDRSTSLASRTRFIHAALGASNIAAAGPLSVFTQAGPTTTVVASSIAPKQTAPSSSGPTSIDSLGYASLPSSSDPVAIKLLGDTDGGAARATSAALLFTPYSVRTVFITSSETDALGGLFVCDEVESASGRTSCQWFEAH